MRFAKIPLEVLVDDIILPYLEISDFLHLCATHSEFSFLKKDEYVWKNLAFRDFHKFTDEEIGKNESWKETYQDLWNTYILGSLPCNLRGVKKVCLLSKQRFSFESSSLVWNLSGIFELETSETLVVSWELDLKYLFRNPSPHCQKPFRDTHEVVGTGMAELENGGSSLCGFIRSCPGTTRIKFEFALLSHGTNDPKGTWWAQVLSLR